MSETIAFLLHFYVRLDYSCLVPTSLKENNDIAMVIETWFKKSARSFPWRTESTPWGRLVSEFMAQQTQIERVAERWSKMMARFPTPRSLAESDEGDILSLWQGLGYYRRAKYLKATAEMITKEFDGKVPSDLGLLLKLPGVGKYTAGAVASIAFGERVPIVDGNVHRVFCRLWNKKNEPISSKWIWSKAKHLVDACSKPQVFNEGLMEFGATRCTSKLPSCDHCPLKKRCVAFHKDTQHEIPPTKRSTQKKRAHHYAVIMENGENIAFEQRGENGLWAGMWQVPTVESPKKLSVLQVSKQLKLKNKLHPAGKFEHILSHRIISFTVFSCRGVTDSRFSWLHRNAIDELPLATAQRKVLAVHCAT